MSNPEPRVWGLIDAKLSLLNDAVAGEEYVDGVDDGRVQEVSSQAGAEGVGGEVLGLGRVNGED